MFAARMTAGGPRSEDDSLRHDSSCGTEQTLGLTRRFRYSLTPSTMENRVLQDKSARDHRPVISTSLSMLKYVRDADGPRATDSQGTVAEYVQ